MRDAVSGERNREFGSPKLLGWKAVPTIALSHLSETERRAYVLADNEFALNAGWDKEILAIELQALVDLDFDVELTGFSLAEIDFFIEETGEADAICKAWANRKDPGLVPTTWQAGAISIP